MEGAEAKVANQLEPLTVPVVQEGNGEGAVADRSGLEPGTNWHPQEGSVVPTVGFEFRRGCAGPQLMVFAGNLLQETGGDSKKQCHDRLPDGEDEHMKSVTTRNGLECPQSSELCHRHRYAAANLKDLPAPGHERLALGHLFDVGWVPGGSGMADPVFDLARKLEDLELVGQNARKGLPKDVGCPCQGVLASSGTLEDPTETSDALLVLEGLESEVDSLETTSCSEEDVNSPCRAFLASGLNDPQKMNNLPDGLAVQRASRAVPGFPVYRDPQTCCVLRDAVDCGEHLNSRTTAGSDTTHWTDTLQNSSSEIPPPFPLNDFTKVRVSRCVSSPSAMRDGERLSHHVPARSRKGSLKFRLSKLFRTKSCNGSNVPVEKRQSVDLASSAGSVTEMGTMSNKDRDLGRKPRLTRTQSAFSPVSFAPVFTGETVSLVDVDISHRGANSPHPPTPPPPPRRSLSLLDDISGPQPGAVLVSPMGLSLQSLPLPPPPPPHAPIQHSLSLNDTFPRISPQGRQMDSQTVQPHCPVNRKDAGSFADSLRELEKCGWYWGPMNWEDAEMKLKGKPDGSFLVRDSSDPRYILSLSFRSQGITHHTRMEHYRGTFSLWCHPKFEDRCHSVVEFIDRAIMHSKNGKFLYFLRSRVPGLPPTPVQLLYPVSRFSNVKSLQHLCRFRIRQLVRIDHIDELPLPKPLISYLRKFYYYDPEEEIYPSSQGNWWKKEPESAAQT
ncbi:suppressor of cytokine signaling 7 [Protopterus annectens]|uniref:suppressor of cytokine signaling 7 n=1 Tax=Protopterus annectens TaxID=7888 RepID=UPI001CF9BDE1|nr:suppressor of cytokine signaling 7 [Protopterus annectens]XP_043911302.1 suppressor of cytokine signaling 7 [Protopterus annectens]